MKFNYLRKRVFSEDGVLLAIHIRFPGSEIDFSFQEMFIASNGKSPAEVKESILKIDGIQGVGWCDGDGGDENETAVSWNSD